MTNEEKAMEIVSGFDAIGMLVEMAEWKDQQFKEYLEKKLNSYLAYSGSDVINIQNMGARTAIKEIINELFNNDNKV